MGGACRSGVPWSLTLRSCNRKPQNTEDKRHLKQYMSLCMLHNHLLKGHEL